MDINLERGRVKPKRLKIGYFNANGLKAQRSEVATFLCDHQLDALLIQETFLKPGIRDPRIANYNLVRNDRTASAVPSFTTSARYIARLWIRRQCNTLRPPSVGSA